MKSTRRLLSIILCLIMCLSLLPTSAFAVDNLVSYGYANAAKTAKFKLFQSNKLLIEGTGTVEAMDQWSFDPPYTWTYDDILATQSEIKTLEVGEGITSIGTSAFLNCPNITSVTLPTSLYTIGSSAFENCQGLTEISIPGNVISIGQSAFKSCTNLVVVNLPTGLYIIGNNAFEDCSHLASIMIPANVLSIGSKAFKNCEALKNITFQCNYTSLLLSSDTFDTVEATANYPADNNSWNSATPSPFQDYGGRITWKAVAGLSSSEGWVQKGNDWYYYVDGKMIQSNWRAFGGKWFYFGADGKMYTGRRQVDGNYYYFGEGKGGYPLGARVSGLVKDLPNKGDLYFYDENGIWQPSYSGVDDNGLDYTTNGWQQSDDGKWFYIRNRAKVTGWLYSNGYWYYLDPVTGAMVTGWLTWKGHTYYLRPLDKAIADGIPDREGSMIAGRTAIIGDTAYTFDNNGALLGGKIEDNPLGLRTGFRNAGTAAKPDWRFFRSDGTMAKGWELVDSTWYYFDKNGKMQTGWIKVGGAWYYLTKWEYSGSGDEDKSENWDEITDPTATDAGKMVTGFNKIPYTRNGVNTVKTYFFKNSGALNGRGWIKVGLKWYFLETDGVVVTGWFRDNSKWYFLDPGTDPIGEMVTGFVTTLADGNNIKDPGGVDNGGESFAVSGEWLGSGYSDMATKAGAWKLHDGFWYYYDANGDDYPTNANAVTGWISLGGKWYYLDPSSSPAGKMLTGWQEIDGETYFFNSDGAALGGWQKIDGVWYYLYPKHDGGFGKMLKGWQYINGNWYYLLETTGALQDGWIKKAANDYDSTEYWFYLEENQNSKTYGAMQKGGWKQIGAKWYYFHNEHDGYYGKLEQGIWIEEPAGTWYFVKPAVPDHPEESWMVTGIYEVKAPAAYPGTYDFGTDGKCKTPHKAGWQKTGDGKWKYVNSDGSIVTGEKTIDAKDYFFDSNGIMQTGVQDVGGGKLYLYGSDGAKVKKTGQQTVDGVTYLFDSTDSHLLTGWQDSNKYYYDEKTGAMLKGLQTIGGKKYYFDTSTGEKKTGWQTVGGNKYYFDPTTGEAQTGWKTIDSKKVYFNDEGVLQTGFQTIDGKKYYFDTETGEAAAGWKTINGKTYRFHSSDNYALTGEQTIGSDKYYFDDEGVMQVGFQKIGGKIYYYGTDGIRKDLASWQTIDGKKYYFHSSDHYVLTGEQTIGGQTFYFDENGVLQE